MTDAPAPVAARFATIYGEPLTEIPVDLYIPPDALEILLDAFQGPLDLLLYLIRRQNLDVLDIPMAPLTRQYLEYVELMRKKNLELAARLLDNVSRREIDEILERIGLAERQHDHVRVYSGLPAGGPSA